MNTTAINNALKTVTDWNATKDRVVYKLVNTDNSIYDLSHIPHRKFFDLSIIFYVVLEYGLDGVSSAIVNDRLLDEWGVDIDTIYEAATRNTPKLLPATINTLEAMMFGMMGGSEEFLDSVSGMNGSNIYVLTNTRVSNGFAAILYPNLLGSIAKNIGSFYILPSSVQEALIVPSAFGMDTASMVGMVRSVNATEVSASDFLSNNIYYFDNSKQEIACICQ